MFTKGCVHKGVWPRSRLQLRAGKSVCKGGEYPLPLYVLRFVFENVHMGANNVLCAVAACKVKREVTRCGEM
jgi:hypothetical protein